MSGHTLWWLNESNQGQTKTDKNRRNNLKGEQVREMREIWVQFLEAYNIFLIEKIDAELTKLERFG